MTKDQIITDIRAAVTALNAAIKEANERNLKVKLTQQFNPMMNTNGASLNAPVKIEITESITIGEETLTVKKMSDIATKISIYDSILPFPF